MDGWMDGGVEAAEKKNPLEDKRASDSSSAYNTNPSYSVIGWFLWGRGEARATSRSRPGLQYLHLKIPFN